MKNTIKNIINDFKCLITSKPFLRDAVAIIVFISISIFSGYALSVVSSYRTLLNILLVVFCLCLFLYRLLTIKIFPINSVKSAAVNLLKSLFLDSSFIYLLILIFASLIAMSVNNDFTDVGIKTFLNQFLMFFAAFLITKIFPFKTIIKYFRKIFPFICLVALVLYIFLNVFNIDYPFNSFTSSYASYDNYFYTFFSFVGLRNRNCGFFWEPALYGLFLCFAVICEILFAERKIRISVLILYLISIITTFSSSSIIILIFALPVCVAIAKKEVIDRNFVILLISSLVCLVAILIVVIFNTNISAKFIVNGKSDTFSTRLYGPGVNFVVMYENPFGVGFSNETAVFFETANRMGVGSSVSVQTFSFGYWISAFGFPGLLLMFIPLLFLVLNDKIPVYASILIALLSLLFALSEPLNNVLFFIILLFYAINESTLFKKKRDICSNDKHSLIKEISNSKNTSLLAKNSLGSFVVKGLAMFISLFTTSAYISYFADPKGEGMLSLWFTILSLLTWILIFDFGIGHGLKNKLINSYAKGSKDTTKKILASSYIGISLISLTIFVVGCTLIFIVDPYNLFNIDSSLVELKSIRLSLVFILLGICMNFVLKLVGNIYESLQKQWVSNLCAVLQTFSILMFVTFFRFTSNESQIIGVSVAYLLASNLPYAFLTLILFMGKFKKYRFNLKDFSLKFSKSVLSLGGVFFLIQISMMLINSTNTFLIQQIFGSTYPGAAAEFTYYHKIFNIIIVVSQLLSGPLWVIIAKAKSENDSKYLRKISRIIIYGIVAFSLLDLVVFLCLPFIFKIWISNADFTFSWMASAIFAINALIVMTVVLFSAISNGLSYLKYQVLGFLIGLILKIITVVLVVVLHNNGRLNEWYFIELTTTIAYLPVLFLLPIGNHKCLRREPKRKTKKIFLLGYFSELIDSGRNAPLAAESICLYIKDVLESNKLVNYEIVNLANSRRKFVVERTKKLRNFTQIGTSCFGRVYRKFLWKKFYWKKIYRFCKQNMQENDVVLIYHSLLNGKLIKKVRANLHIKTILIGAEFYSDVTNNVAGKRIEQEMYGYANAHILISDALKNEIYHKRPSIILNGDYRDIDIKCKEKFNLDGKKHLVYAGTFDPVKGGVFSAIQTMALLDDSFVLHILGFGNINSVKREIENLNLSDKVIIEGELHGQELVDFLSRCDIGLSTQNSYATFNSTSFPSKIVLYTKCGLKIVSTPTPSLLNSPFKKNLFISSGDKPENIKDAIIKATKKNIKQIRINQIRTQFESEFWGLINQISNSKRFLFVNNCFGGSTGTICREIHEYVLQQGQDSLFAYATGKSKRSIFYKKYSCRIESYISACITRINGDYFGNMLGATQKLIRITQKYKPNLINLHCVNSYSLNLSKYFNYVKTLSLPVVLTNHALFYATGSCGYPYNGCKGYLKGCKNCPNKRYASKSIFIDRASKNWISMKNNLNDPRVFMTSVSDYVNNFCASSKITKKIPNKTILNGIDTSVFSSAKRSKTRNAQTTILYVTSDINNHNKGFDQFCSIAKELNNDSFKFIVVGDKKKKKFNQNNVLFLGKINNINELAEIYASCDLLLITSRNETFSLPVAESLCSGTPIVGFKCGGPESFAPNEYSKFFDFGDCDGVIRYIKSKKYLLIDRKKCSVDSKRLFDKQMMLDKYLDFYNYIFNKNA